jgi:hypothetical protein
LIIATSFELLSTKVEAFSSIPCANRANAACSSRPDTSYSPSLTTPMACDARTPTMLDWIAEGTSPGIR